MAESKARQFDAALGDLEQAKKLDPEYFGLWFGCGYRSSLMGKRTEATVFYQKETEIHPDNMPAYDGAVSEQLALGQRKEAEATLRQRLTHRPDDKSSLQLGQLLMADEDFNAAIAVLGPASTSFPDNQNLRLTLGKADIAAGNASEGTSILTGTIAGTNGKAPDAFYLNEAAYTLADANVALDIADRAVHHALDQLAAESALLTPDTDIKKTNPRTSLIVATWDTLGWVFFREHRFTDAESYLRAAWIQGKHPEVGLHLGQVQEALGDPKAALATYTEADAISARQRARATSLPASAIDRSLASHIAALQAKMGRPGKPPVPAPNATAATSKPPALTEEGTPETGVALSDPIPKREVHTVPLGDADGANGIRGFVIILSADGIVADKGSGDTTPLKNEEAILHRLSTATWWPANSPVKLYIKGDLSCQNDECEFRYFAL